MPNIQHLRQMTNGMFKWAFVCLIRSYPISFTHIRAQTHTHTGMRFVLCKRECLHVCFHHRLIILHPVKRHFDAMPAARINTGKCLPEAAYASQDPPLDWSRSPQAARYGDEPRVSRPINADEDRR